MRQCKGGNAAVEPGVLFVVSWVAPVLQGRSLGCKPAVALMQYMEASGTSLEQLQQQLEPLLAAEQQLGADAQDLPTPTPAMDPEARTAALVEAATTAKQQNGHASGSSQLQRGRASLARLLGNVTLCHETLAVMRDGEGFKQVAWGQLELWYCHDTARHRQIIRGRVVLDEPVQVRSAWGAAARRSGDMG
jgi:hypothetical protein